MRYLILCLLLFTGCRPIKQRCEVGVDVEAFLHDSDTIYNYYPVCGELYSSVIIRYDYRDTIMHGLTITTTTKGYSNKTFSLPEQIDSIKCSEYSLAKDYLLKKKKERKYNRELKKKFKQSRCKQTN